MGSRDSSKFSVQPNNILQFPCDVSELALVQIDFGQLKGDFLSPAPKEYQTEGRIELIFPLEVTGNSL